MRILETERLRLRPFRMDDLEEAHRQFDLHPDAWRFDPGYPPDLEHRRRWLNYRIQQFQMHGFGARAIELKDTGELIGLCGLDLGLQMETQSSAPVVELYYRLGREFWGNGYATEAVVETLRHAFEDLKLERISAHVDVENEASVNLLRRVGFDMFTDPDREGVLRGSLSAVDWHSQRKPE